MWTGDPLAISWDVPAFIRKWGNLSPDGYNSSQMTTLPLVLTTASPFFPPSKSWPRSSPTTIPKQEPQASLPRTRVSQATFFFPGCLPQWPSWAIHGVALMTPMASPVAVITKILWESLWSEVKSPGSSPSSATGRLWMPIFSFQSSFIV